MSNAISQPPVAVNEPVYSYAPGSAERDALKKAIQELKNKEIEIPMYIGGEEVFTDKRISIHPPHELKYKLGDFSVGNHLHVQKAVDAALDAKASWENLPWENRVSIFLKAADLLAGPYRAKMNAATMLCQSKNPFQSEIDAVCELIDFWRFNAEYMYHIYSEQPQSSEGMWNRFEHRALEGFIFAITPFNFTSIAGNLPSAPAMMGNTVVWKPAFSQIYSAWVVMEILREAGLPEGVINLVYTDGPETGDVVFNHPDFSGLHFTGSTEVFRNIWKIIGNNISKYKTYPRIIGETGGKDFIVAHRSAEAKSLATAIVRGGFEFQGQKCSAASRVYIPSNLWADVKKYLLEELKTIHMGNPEDFRNFFNAVIDEKAFDKIAGYIDQAKKDGVEVLAGGNYDKSEGYFIEPTVLLTNDPKYTTMQEEIFGPVVTIYVYDENKYAETLDLVDSTSPYALTGAVFSKDRYAVQLAVEKLRHSAGNFYINDKPTGAVVGQQPFGGSRASGTNDKAGGLVNLLRWTSPRTIKETFVPPKDYRYPFMDE